MDGSGDSWGVGPTDKKDGGSGNETRVTDVEIEGRDSWIGHVLSWSPEQHFSWMAVLVGNVQLTRGRGRDW